MQKERKPVYTNITRSLGSVDVKCLPPCSPLPTTPRDTRLPTTPHSSPRTTNTGSVGPRQSTKPGPSFPSPLNINRDYDHRMQLTRLRLSLVAEDKTRKTLEFEMASYTS